MVSDQIPHVASWLAQGASEPFAYLTTIGRRSGQPHRIEIWFAVQDGQMYMLSGGRDRSDWVRNLQANPDVTVELRGETWRGTARVITQGSVEDELARDLLVRKYATSRNPLEDWKRRSLPVAIEFPPEVRT